MNLALLFYSWAFFSGRRQDLHFRHLLIFGKGLLCDFPGSMEMN